MPKIAVYGAGSWGSALAVLLAKAGHQVALVGRHADEMENMRNQHENKRYLPGVVLPQGLFPTTDLSFLNADLVVLSVPSHSVREAARMINPFLRRGCIVVNTAKGMEEGTHCRLSEVLIEELPNNPVAVLSGPSHAEEVGRDMPTTVVVASDVETAKTVQDMMMTPKFRVYTNPDVIGVELGGALKNVIALCTGIAEGLGFGDNTKAALMTRGLAEIARLGVALGGNPLTFAGLSGVGDLIVTCTSLHSRNRRAGVALGQGKPLETVLREVGMVVEGVRATRIAHFLGIEKNIAMPITEQAYKVLFENADPKIAVADLMLRGKRHELEEVVEMSWLR
ncbi:NAD(P)H-dependent glycerol-3-phosphate dehydrogenase [Desulfosporosinus nitroreducens]|uniref:Glycerol-3-phosphate dehydrogenase [NAD(P)+] n=1 Tax=Desulfosporosinus nitroreducens TaxID=2018668 RepID=A0ABT8QSK8_9FIRM|nr:NAD(P)H-dependent glycerol-3-phosphate dehydrogenase [Desulfosporosinus nitroreducens]MCO1599904.1 NAD(P)H-dependent glycerol-3-phosphate dehydrogenase [Desulfosporosinus nitroreducens]MDO0823053.1 NAD(P)H-dependent glycerol-3-phosphate dehydrogenase [Desulfosporosinus nitroreducens]